MNRGTRLETEVPGLGRENEHRSAEITAAANPHTHYFGLFPEKGAPLELILGQVGPASVQE